MLTVIFPSYPSPLDPWDNRARIVKNVHVPPLVIDSESKEKSFLQIYSRLSVSEPIVTAPTSLAVVGPIVEVKSYCRGALQRHLTAPMAIEDIS